jgi:hypothetical protein
LPAGIALDASTEELARAVTITRRVADLEGQNGPVPVDAEVGEPHVESSDQLHGRRPEIADADVCSAGAGSPRPIRDGFTIGSTR